MAKRGDNLFLMVALGLGAVAYVLFRKPAVAAGPATGQGLAQGGVPGSPNQPVQITSAQAQAAAREIAALGI
jgi:hypothetical protein